jgi:hypothetical protein
MGKQRRKRARSRVAGEHGPVEWTTVAWMLAAVTAAACLIAWALVRGAALVAEGPRPPGALLHFGGLMLFAALVSGLANLVLAAVVFRQGPGTAPPAIWAFSLTVGLLPAVLLWFA